MSLRVEEEKYELNVALLTFNVFNCVLCINSLSFFPHRVFLCGILLTGKPETTRVYVSPADDVHRTRIFGMRLADVLDLSAVVYPLAEISANRTLEHFHHEGKQGTRQGSIPPAFRGFVADKGMLRLHLQELRALSITAC